MIFLVDTNVMWIQNRSAISLLRPFRSAPRTEEGKRECFVRKCHLLGNRGIDGSVVRKDLRLLTEEEWSPRQI